MHWFDESLFMAEVRRVLRPEGVLAIWAYQLGKVSAECDAIIDTLYEDIVDEYWPPERMIVDQGYPGLMLPGEAVLVPDFAMSLKWRAADMLGYLRTWSASKRYEAANGTDPVNQIESELIAQVHLRTLFSAACIEIGPGVRQRALVFADVRKCFDIIGLGGYCDGWRTHRQHDGNKFVSRTIRDSRKR